MRFLCSKFNWFVSLIAKKVSAHFPLKFLLLTVSFSLQAGVFGDANDENGYEDERLARAQTENWPKEFRSVGRIICNGRVQGSAVLLNFNSISLASITGLESSDGHIVGEQPVVLTAKHVVERFDLADCHFSPESYEWHKAPILSIYSTEPVMTDDALSNDSKETKTPVTERYKRDWLLLSLEPWPSWQAHALMINLSYQQHVSELRNQDLTAYMVGFDLIKNQIVADYSCRFGFAEQTRLLIDVIDEDLLWDDCDSEKGSSGGALFVQNGDELLLVGIRVGSLFDANHFKGEPKIGEKFDLDSYINVSRVLPF